jgi:16S rRNA (cytosine1402-N4)-methyltransferase
MNIEHIDGLLLDLGLSSYQIDTDQRGFSYMKNTALDMRMDQNTAMTASDLLNTLDEGALSTIFYTYGEERKSRQIARQVVNYRRKEKITRSDQLRHIIDTVIHPRNAIKSYARVFQSLRIAVNQELDNLEKTLEKSIDTIKPGGRWVIISYHSLEDRIVKNFFKIKADPCICPEEFPKCVCNKTAEIKLITKKAIMASKNEIQTNPRARSARLRVGEKI